MNVFLNTHFALLFYLSTGLANRDMDHLLAILLYHLRIPRFFFEAIINDFVVIKRLNTQVNHLLLKYMDYYSFTFSAQNMIAIKFYI